MLDRGLRVFCLVTLSLLVGLSLTGRAVADRFAYLDEQMYLNDLAVLGFAAIPEGFEDDVAWGEVRSTIAGGTRTLPSVNHLGVTWSANNPDSEITTGPGPARSGAWGFFTLPHGSYLTGTDCHLPGHCGDGWIGTAWVKLYGVSGWIDTNTYGAKVELILDGDSVNPVDFGEVCDPSGENCTNPTKLGTAPTFFGVIDTDGFNHFEFAELEGTSEDVKLLFADDFTFGFAPAACNDLLDNDGDGLIDYDGAGVGSPDPQCADMPWKETEAAGRCGLGFELTFVLPPLLWSYRRTRRASRERGLLSDR